MPGTAVRTVAVQSREVLERAWVAEHGFTQPNPDKYPWRWLWDSCFHAIAWSGLGDARGVAELRSVLSAIRPNGFLPHMGYPQRPRWSTLEWHVVGRSTITQPPMYGHALRVLAERGFDVSELLAPATRAMNHLFDSRMDTPSGLLRIVHPWESGCDDSARWDGWSPVHYRRSVWNGIKHHLLRRMVVVRGEAIGNPDFEVCSVGFNALAAFNALELAALTGDNKLRARAEDLVTALDKRWSPRSRTWVDLVVCGPVKSRQTGAIATLDALLPLLVSRNPDHVRAALAMLGNPDEFDRPFGPAGVEAGDPSYRPSRYWRGSAWPQLTYLLMVAAQRQGQSAVAVHLAIRLREGALRSGFAEHWNAETGEGLGARPQSWTALANEAELLLRRPGAAPPLSLAG